MVAILSTNFHTFTAAANSLAKYGVSGPVVFKIADGYYREEFTFNRIKGSSKSNTVLFESKSLTKVVLRNGSKTSTYVINYSYASRITLKNITITHTGKNGVIINLGDSCNDNQFINEAFKGDTGDYILYRNLNKYYFHPCCRNVWDNNYFSNGSCAFCWVGTGYYSDTSDIIKNNMIILLAQPLKTTISPQVVKALGL